MSKRVSVGDLITVRGREWTVDAIDGDTIHVARAYRATTVYSNVQIDEIDSCSHEGRLLAMIESLYALRSEIDTPDPMTERALRMIDDMIHEAKGEQ